MPNKKAPRQVGLQMQHRVLIIIAIVILAVALLCFTGFVYNTVASTRLARAHPVPGTFYTVDGRLMHIDCTGEGTPTVILESGIGDDWLIWQAVQPELSEATRVCSYDRFGLGWSEPSSGARDAVSIAAQLHTLLNVAKISGPLLLVGHSGGGLYIRAFTVIYPENVVGVVFVDATSTKLYRAIPEATETPSQRRDRHHEAQWRAFQEAIGWTRLTGGCGPDVPSPLRSFADLDAPEECRPTYETSSLGERDELQHSAEEVANLPCCGKLPNLIISQDPDRHQPGWGPQNMNEKPIWGDLQEQMKSLSACSERIIARSSGHHVMIDRPEVIVRNLKVFIQHQRKTPECPYFGETEIQ